MKSPDLLIIDDFFEDPDAVRNFALSVPYDFVANYPGMRTRGVHPVQSFELKEKFEKILNRQITRWDIFDGNSEKYMNTCYQICLKEDWTWVHHDMTDWAAVVYLSPGADPDSGTGFFRHKETGISRWDRDDPSTDFHGTGKGYDLEQWELIAEIKNIYNRCILYKADQYHRSMVPGFGNTYISGRMTQVFFFDTHE